MVKNKKKYRCVVKDFGEGKGLGLFANELIPANTDILIETPKFMASLVADLHLVLTEEEKLKLNTRDGADLEEKFFKNIQYLYAVDHPELKNDQGAFFETASLFNHSCVNNCHATWDDKHKYLLIHSTRNIEEGEELTINYLPINQQLLCFKERQLVLVEKLNGQDCFCSLCQSEPKLVNLSDSRRKEICQLRDSYLASTKNISRIFLKIAILVEEENLPLLTLGKEALMRTNLDNEAFEVGATIRIHGFVERNELNGRRGRIVKAEKNKLWCVLLDKFDENYPHLESAINLEVKVSNMILICPAENKLSSVLEQI